jgi:hypothetical protein
MLVFNLTLAAIGPVSLECGVFAVGCWLHKYFQDDSFPCTWHDRVDGEGSVVNEGSQAIM